MDDAIETIARRVRDALLELPNFKRGKNGEAIEEVSGDRVAPSRDDRGEDHSVFVITRADGSIDQVPAHHYLDDQLLQAAAGDAALSREMLEALRQQFAI
jgi:hypothetical protein